MNFSLKKSLLFISISIFPIILIGQSFNQGNTVFEGAAGFGANWTFSEDYEVIVVTNLNSSGPGSLKDAVESRTSRRAKIIVFNGLSGTIVSNSIIRTPRNHQIYIAGQTSKNGILIRGSRDFPGPIIQIRGGDGIIIRGLTLAIGATSNNNHVGDNISVDGGRNILIDHCTVLWSSDENIGAWYDPENVTIQNSIIAEALMYSTHEYTTDSRHSQYRSPHSMGSLVGDRADKFTYYNNLFANNNQRNPLINSRRGTFEIVNNVMFNHGSFGMIISSPSDVNFINNYAFKNNDINLSRYDILLTDSEANAFARGNINTHRNSANQDEWDAIGGVAPYTSRASSRQLSSQAFNTPLRNIPTIDHQRLIGNILGEGGVGTFSRNDAEKRVINYVTDKSGGRLIDDPSEVGGYPRIPSGTIILDSNNNGIPDGEEGVWGDDTFGYINKGIFNQPPTPEITADAGEDQSICQGQSATLTASGGSTYLWSNGETTQSITVNPDETNTYSVTVSEGNASDTDEVIVNVNPLPVAGAGANMTIEAGQSVTLSASGEGNYLWSTGETTQSITVSPNSTTTYEVTVSNGNCEDKDTVRVTVNQPPTPEITADAGEDQSICQGQSATLTASGGSTYLWSNGETTQSITVNPDETNTYSVTVSEGNASDTDEVIVNVNPLPVAGAGANMTIEAGQSVTLSASGEGNYLWSTGETTQSITVSPNSTTTYEVTVSNGNCEDKDTVRVTVNQPPTPEITADAGEDQSICQGQSATLTASGGSTYLWSNGETTQSITVNPDETNTYSVTVSEGNASDTDEVIVNVNPLPVAGAGANMTIEAGQSVTLSASGEGNYLWSTGETTQSITVSPNSTTTYEVTVSNGNCEDKDTVRVTVNQPPTPEITADAGEDQSICQGQSATLTASGGSTYLWSNGETTQSITVNPDETNTYSVTVSEGNASDTDEVIVNVNPLPVAGAGANMTIEAGQSVTLSASGEGNYLWSTGETTQSITVSPNSTTTYEVTVSNGNCEDKDTVRVTVNQPPTPEITADAGEDQSICQGQSATLTASGGSTYLWSNGETTQSITVNPDETNTYSVTVSEGNASDTDEVIVNVNPLPVAGAGANMTIEAGQSVTLSASGEGNYLWSTGETTQSITVSPNSTTTYEVTVSNGNCEDKDTVRVTVNQPPTPEITADAGEDQSICQGQSATLTASGGSTYLWSNGETTQSITVNPDETNTYSVTVSEGNASDTDEVIVNVNPLPVAGAGANMTIEAGQSVTLSASGEGNYLWSTGETTQSITVSPNSTTTYEVTVSNGNCEDKDTVRVTVNQPPTPEITADAGEDQSICQGQSITLNAPQGENYIWTTGDFSNSITISPKRTTAYTLTYTRNELQYTIQTLITVKNCESNDEEFNNGNEQNLTNESIVKNLNNNKENIIEQSLELKIYPNPTNGIINLHSSKLGNNYKLLIYNLNGQMIHSSPIYKENQIINEQFDFSNYPKGIYIIKLFNLLDTHSRKIIVI
ncbi:T9SS type A sorting domain-containing protein [Lutimonas zeaxanthinifaciens]|uniref:T9SS type A sorting domain-containing protein n=1 Tax=Lutimonas zeaxanthinifaciens TaxID=3060215 RepID=UPI00265D06D7|nr:T9SS type A sorting domain-containing protein [Lutimonas sp. YSD2104]WKK66824.1 T9SS type A sorting domain-containing protein [Lutimonas sp. YSD2104]